MCYIENNLCELRKLNNRIFLIQQKIIAEAQKISLETKKRSENKNDILDDYEIEIEVQFFLKENDPEYNDEDDNIITTIYEYSKFLPDGKDTKWCFETQNHNEFVGWKQHQMKDDYHCWWFHCLYDHNQVDFKDMLRIGTIWTDIKVQYQYISE